MVPAADRRSARHSPDANLLLPLPRPLCPYVHRVERKGAACLQLKTGIRVAKTCRGRRRGSGGESSVSKHVRPPSRRSIRFACRAPTLLPDARRHEAVTPCSSVSSRIRSTNSAAVGSPWGHACMPISQPLPSPAQRNGLLRPALLVTQSRYLRKSICRSRPLLKMAPPAPSIDKTCKRGCRMKGTRDGPAVRTEAGLIRRHCKQPVRTGCVSGNEPHWFFPVNRPLKALVIAATVHRHVLNACRAFKSMPAAHTRAAAQVCRRSRPTRSLWAGPHQSVQISRPNVRSPHPPSPAQRSGSDALQPHPWH